eukprot:CAMPEP_0197435244 /NCGR_PEP_ID=MMETSP1175-20131217/2861_1 /TAXON_ID=1003142 /ORGANISM="Triceratium dubium, Strain CCMP147" /LENGTH=944 /DNA_ID=CAMNT_0042964231 /DNA_START=40 /DNA_END=2874 /DNA_ORIENTATION=+
MTSAAPFRVTSSPPPVFSLKLSVSKEETLGDVAIAQGEEKGRRRRKRRRKNTIEGPDPIREMIFSSVASPASSLFAALVFTTSSVLSNTEYSLAPSLGWLCLLPFALAQTGQSDLAMPGVVEVDVEIGLYNSKNYTAQDVVDGEVAPPGNSFSYKTRIEGALFTTWSVLYPSADRLNLALAQDTGRPEINITSGSDIECPDYVPPGTVSGAVNQCLNLTARLLVRAADDDASLAEDDIRQDVIDAFQEAQRDGTLTEEINKYDAEKVFRVQSDGGNIPCFFCPPGFSFQRSNSERKKRCSNPIAFASSETCDALRMGLVNNSSEFLPLTYDCGYCVPNKPKKIQQIIKRRGLCMLCENGKVPQKDSKTAVSMDGVGDSSCGELANGLIVSGKVGDDTCQAIQQNEEVAKLCGCGKSRIKVRVNENGECPEGMNVCKNKPNLCCQGGGGNGGGDDPFEDCPVVPEHTDNIFAVTDRYLQKRQKKRGNKGKRGKKKVRKDCPTLVDIAVNLYNSANYTAQSVLDGGDDTPRIAIETALASVWETKYGKDNVDNTALNESGRRLAAALDLELVSGPIVYEGFDISCPPAVPATSESGAANTCQNFTASLGVIPSFIGNSTAAKDLTPDEIAGDVIAAFEEAKADGNLTKELSKVEGGDVWSAVHSDLEQNNTGDGDGNEDNSTIVPPNATETSSPVPTPSPTMAPTTRDAFMEGVVEVDVEIGLYNSKNHTAQDVLDGTATPPGSNFSYNSIIEAALGFVWPIKYPSVARLDLELAKGMGLKSVNITSGIDIDCPDYIPPGTVSGAVNKCQNLTARFLVRSTGNETFPEKVVQQDVNDAYQEAQRDGNLTEQINNVDIWKVFRVQSAWELYTAGDSGTPGASTQSSDQGSSPNIGAIVGGVVGGIVLLCCCLATFVLYRNRSNKVDKGGDLENAKSDAETWNNDDNL